MQPVYGKRRAARAALGAACLALGALAAAGPARASPSIVEWSVGRRREPEAARDRADIVTQLRSRPQDAGLHLRHGRLLTNEYLTHRTADWRPAAAAFEFALQLDPSLSSARLELGRLYAAVGRASLASQLFGEYVSLQPDDGAAFADLSLAALRSGDLTVALWAGRRGASLSGGAREVAAAAMAAGVLEAPDAASLQGRLSGLDPALAASVTRDVAAWRQGARLAAALPPPKLQVAAPSPVAGAPAPQAGTLPWPSVAPTTSGAMLTSDWRSCDPIAAAARAAASAALTSSTFGQSVSGGAGTTPISPQPLQPLAGPCADTPQPPMAVIEAVIVRQVDELADVRGVNLLSTLQLVARGRLRVAEERPTGTEPANNNFLTVSLPDGGLTYLMNILEDRSAQADVLAKPSLVALDRTPSLFFSGSTIAVPVIGQYSGTLQEKVIGVSLAVTPTFLSDDEMLLAVNAGRSFLEAEVDAQVDQGIQTTTNTVTANVRIRFGETLVLSGLVEREDGRIGSEVPVLGRVPGANLFLAQKTRRSTRHNVLVLLTPRRANETGQPANSDDSLLAERHDRRLADAVAALARTETPEAAQLDELARRLSRADLLDKLPITTPAR
ncbi:hypothetical protein ACO2Q0_21220 [Phenylobacterium sp. VNQ135]|uniref:hypothetical protein n=1 Tax=Phenylobacterium sp. VNQ135 TaxID=3400922 RepID=UPI003BFB13CA